MEILEKKEKDGKTDVCAILEGQVCSSRCEIFFAPNIYGHRSLWSNCSHDGCLLWPFFFINWLIITDIDRNHSSMEIKDRASPTLSFGSLLMVFSGLRTRSTLRDLMVLMSRPLLFLY